MMLRQDNRCPVRIIEDHVGNHRGRLDWFAGNLHQAVKRLIAFATADTHA